MSDVVTQLAAYRAALDDLAPEITISELQTPMGHAAWSRFKLRPLTVVLAAAVAVLLLIGGSALLFSGDGSIPPATVLPAPPTTVDSTPVEESEPEATESAGQDKTPAGSADNLSEAQLAYGWLVGVVLETANILDLQPVVVAPATPFVYETPNDSPGLLAATSANLQDSIPEHEFGFDLYLFETPEAASAYIAVRMEGITPDSGAPAIPTGDESFPGGPCGRGCPVGQFVRSGSLLIEVRLPFEEERLDLAVTHVNAVFSAAATEDEPVAKVIDAPGSDEGSDLHFETQIDVYDSPEDGDWKPAFSWTVFHGPESGSREPVCSYRISDRRGVDDISFRYGILPDGTIAAEPFPIGGGTELAEGEPAYQETIDMCDRYTFGFSPEDWDLADLLGPNTGYPGLVNVIALEDGNYSALAGSWHFVFDALPALPGVFGQDESLTVSDVRVHTDGSRQHIDSIELLVQGPTAALEQALGIDIPEDIQNLNPIVRITSDGERPWGG